MASVMAILYSKILEPDGLNIKKRSRLALELNKQDDRVEHKLIKIDVRWSTIDLRSLSLVAY